MKYPEGLYHREPSKTEEPFPFDKFQTRDIMNKVITQ